MEFLNSIADFIDENIRIVRYTAPLLAIVGASVIFHHTHVFTVFKSANDIPAHIIRRNLPLRGITTDILNDGVIKAQHFPILFRNLDRRQKYLGQKRIPLKISLAGISPKQGCSEYLHANLLNKNIKIIPLNAAEENCLEAVVFLKKGILSRSININEDLIAKGLAIVHHDEKLANLRAYKTLSKQLLTAEIKADKSGRGVWTRPSFTEKVKRSWEMLKRKIRSKLYKQT